MSSVFLKIVNMSFTASWVILAVILVRLLLKKAPKWIPCLLWGLVAIRLVCPFSFRSIFSLIPSVETIPANITVQHAPAINSGITVVNEFINPVITQSFSPAAADSANPLQIIIHVAAIVWISGIVIMLGYAFISYMKLKKMVSVCVPVDERVLSCDEVKTPFILGVLRPVIYVPSSMTGETLDLVIRHEAAHLQRHDHWWKPLGYLLLTVYWFNPLCWIAYILLSRDIEMACDEKVVRDMDKEEMAAYSQALLDCSFPRKRMAACPLAFGEVGVKERVKGVLHYKKPSFWIIVVAVAACIMMAICFLTSPTREKVSGIGLHPETYLKETKDVVEQQLEASQIPFRETDDALTASDTIRELPFSIRFTFNEEQECESFDRAYESMEADANIRSVLKEILKDHLNLYGTPKAVRIDGDEKRWNELSAQEQKSILNGSALDEEKEVSILIDREDAKTFQEVRSIWIVINQSQGSPLRMQFSTSEIVW